MDANRKYFPLPHGLFRYLYYHYRVRSPARVDEILLDVGGGEAATAFNTRSLARDLAEQSWLIGLARPDLDKAVDARWEELSPLARGDYLAGRTERSVSEHSRGDAFLAWLRDRLFGDAKVEFSAETACELGCNLLALEQERHLVSLLDTEFDWTQEIERKGLARSWKEMEALSGRVIDILLEAALVFGCEDVAKPILEKGADPDVPIWRLERSFNGLYSALAFAISNGRPKIANLLLNHGADVRGSDLAKGNSPLSEAMLRRHFALAEQLLSLGACFDDGERYPKAPSTYGWSQPVEWVEQHLGDLVKLAPLESKPIFFWPYGQGRRYFTLLECLFRNPEALPEFESLGLDLRLTSHELARLINDKAFEAFHYLVGREGEEVRDKALSRIRRKWPEFGNE